MLLRVRLFCCYLHDCVACTSKGARARKRHHFPHPLKKIGRVGETYTCVRLRGVGTVNSEREKACILSYTVRMYGSGQPYELGHCGRALTIHHTHHTLHSQNIALTIQCEEGVKVLRLSIHGLHGFQVVVVLASQVLQQVQRTAADSLSNSKFACVCVCGCVCAYVGVKPCKVRCTGI
jgi:hypothetical protein